MKIRTLELLLLTTLFSVGAMGQINCSSGSSSDKLVCQFPYSVGALTNDTALGGAKGTAGAQAKANLVATGFNSAVASQVSQLPLATASAGTVVLYKQGVPETFDNLGPILTDRAQTVGKHRFFIGFTASQFVFTNIDGISLAKLPFAYSVTAFNPQNNQQVLSNTFTGESTALQFKLNQFTGVATYGVTNRVDVSVIVPIERVSIGATTFGATSYIYNANNDFVFAYTDKNTHTPGTASGVGDINFDVKSEVWRGEHATFSAAMGFRAPTGDELNYLGSGAWGFNPYIVYSYLWKVAPHAKFGYQWNTKTELNNPSDTAGQNLNLPGGMQYDIGADWAALHRLTLAADLLGSQYLNAPRLVSSGVALPGPIPGNASPSLTGLTSQDSSYSINNLSVGAKWNPVRNLVLSGNVLFQINDNGLRSRPTPLGGISYKF